MANPEGRKKKEAKSKYQSVTPLLSWEVINEIILKNNITRTISAPPFTNDEISAIETTIENGSLEQLAAVLKKYDFNIKEEKGALIEACANIKQDYYRRKLNPVLAKEINIKELHVTGNLAEITSYDPIIKLIDELNSAYESKTVRKMQSCLLQLGLQEEQAETVLKAVAPKEFSQMEKEEKAILTGSTKKLVTDYQQNLFYEQMHFDIKNALTTTKKIEMHDKEIKVSDELIELPPDERPKLKVTAIPGFKPQSNDTVMNLIGKLNKAYEAKDIIEVENYLLKLGLDATQAMAAINRLVLLNGTKRSATELFAGDNVDIGKRLSALNIEASCSKEFAESIVKGIMDAIKGNDPNEIERTLRKYGFTHVDPGIGKEILGLSQPKEAESTRSMVPSPK